MQLHYLLFAQTLTEHTFIDLSHWDLESADRKIKQDLETNCLDKQLWQNCIQRTKVIKI